VNYGKLLMEDIDYLWTFFDGTLAYTTPTLCDMAALCEGCICRCLQWPRRTTATLTASFWPCWPTEMSETNSLASTESRFRSENWWSRSNGVARSPENRRSASFRWPTYTCDYLRWPTIIQVSNLLLTIHRIATLNFGKTTFCLRDLFPGSIYCTFVALF